MSHPHVDWIPAKYGEKMVIIWTLDNEPEKYDAPMVWIEHGIPDNHVIERKQFFPHIHYLCSNQWTYKKLKKEGLKAYYVGSIYIDKTIPDRRNTRFFIYCPQHARMENHGMPNKWNHNPLTKEQLKFYCKKYECEDYITSIIDDTQRDLYAGLNPMLSNRWIGMGQLHYKKCKYLYENAKVIYTDIMSTFDIVGEAHGIEILGREKQKKPRLYDHIEIMIDGKSCTRTLEVLDKILGGK